MNDAKGLGYHQFQTGKLSLIFALAKSSKSYWNNICAQGRGAATPRALIARGGRGHSPRGDGGEQGGKQPQYLFCLLWAVSLSARPRVGHALFEFSRKSKLQIIYNLSF